MLSTLTSENPLHPTYFRRWKDGSTLRSLELLWILMWAHLSADILKMVSVLFSGVSDSATEYPQQGACTTAQVERTLTCIVQAVTCAVHSSRGIWSHGLGLNSEGRHKSPSWKHANPALEPQLFLAATADVLTFVKDLGFNPVYHNHLRWENNSVMRSLDTNVGRTSRTTDAMDIDLMVCQVIAFVAQMKHLTDTYDKLRPDATSNALIRREILKHTLQEKFPIADSADDGLAGFLAGVMDTHTKGFDLRGVLALIEFTEPLSLEEGGQVDPCTHSISKFMQVRDGD